MKALGKGMAALGIWLALGTGAAWAQEAAPDAAASLAPAMSDLRV